MECRKLQQMRRNAIDRQNSDDYFVNLRAFYDMLDIEHAMDAGLHAPGCNCEDDDEEDTPIFVEHGGEG